MEVGIELTGDGNTRIDITLEEPYFTVENIHFNFTAEGVVTDLFDGEEIVGTHSITYQELIEIITRPM